MHHSDLPSRGHSNDGASETANIPIGAEITPTGMGSEAAEGIHGMGVHAPGQRSSLDDRETGSSFRAGAKRAGSEPLLGRTRLHVSGYGGRLGKPRTSSDQRESFDEDIAERDGVDARHSPFYEWLHNAAIRELVHRIHELSAGERLVLIKGLVPGLVSAMGLAEFDAFLSEISNKARRFQEAVDHPGVGREFRVMPGEQLGGPTPTGHDHLPTARDPDHRGAREAERVAERDLWSRGDHVSALPHGS
jgi:hypothetical protein